MIMGLGMDLVEIARIRSFLDRWGDEGLRRIFADGELDYCLALSDPGPSLAARFAAKEAFFKAVGTGWGRGGDWREVEVRRAGSGDPTLVLHGRAAAVAERSGGRRLHLTLTHTGSMAGAVVIMEG